MGVGGGTSQKDIKAFQTGVDSITTDRGKFIFE
jgi:hypothetical protein